MHLAHLAFPVVRIPESTAKVPALCSASKREAASAIGWEALNDEALAESFHLVTPHHTARNFH